MCEINPKKVQKFVVEFFTAHEIPLDKWNSRVAGAMVDFEVSQNHRGDIRCHVHADNGAMNMADNLHKVFMTQAQDYMKFAETEKDNHQKEVLLAKSQTLLWVLDNMVQYLKDNPSAKM